MKCLVTGPSGLIGSHVIEALVKRGHQVRALARETSDLSMIRPTGAQIVYGDLTDPASIESAIRGVDWVFHTAARMNDWGPWSEFLAHNVQGTENLLRAARQVGVKRFVHVSSTGGTGLCALRDVDEAAPYRPEGHYEESKVQSEQVALHYHRRLGVPVTIVRPCWTLGPRARRHIPLMVEYLGAGKLMY